MKYRNPNTGLGTFACTQIVRPVSKQPEDLFQVIDTRGRNWICCEIGAYIMADITITDDPLVDHIAKAMGESVFTIPIGTGYGMAPPLAGWKRGDNWIGRIVTIDTPSIEELPKRLALISVNINGRRIYPDLPPEIKLKKIGSSALDPELTGDPISEDEHYETPSFLNTVSTFLKRG